MAAKNVGMIMKHNHKRVVVLRTGLKVDGAEAVMIAPLNPAKPGRGVRFVEAKTWYDDYWIPLGQVSVVKAVEVVHAFTGPGRLPKGTLNAVLKEIPKTG